MGSGLPGAGQGRGSPGGCAGEVREGVEEGQGADAGAGSARSRAGAGRARAGPWEAGARGGVRKYSCNFLKVLQRVRASGRRRHGASPRPPAPPWTRSRRPVPGTGPRGRLGVHRPRRGAAGREPGASAPARSRPHVKNDQATIKTREATTWCAATPCYRHGRRRRARGPGPPVGAGQHQAQLTRPPPASPSDGAPTRPAGASTCGPAPAHPGPAAGRRRPDRRTPRRSN